jgi:hypothetical protein
MSAASAPWRRSASIAPASRLSATKLLKRPTTSAKRALCAVSWPSVVLISWLISVPSSFVTVLNALS